MKTGLEHLTFLIEHLRHKMHHEAKTYGLRSTQTLKASQDLDKVLNEYYKLKRQIAPKQDRVG